MAKIVTEDARLNITHKGNVDNDIVRALASGGTVAFAEGESYASYARIMRQNGQKLVTRVSLTGGRVAWSVKPKTETPAAIPEPKTETPAATPEPKTETPAAAPKAETPRR